jgi:hypothetical protein
MEAFAVSALNTHESLARRIQNVARAVVMCKENDEKKELERIRGSSYLLSRYFILLKYATDGGPKRLVISRWLQQWLTYYQSGGRQSDFFDMRFTHGKLRGLHKDVADAIRANLVIKARPTRVIIAHVITHLDRSVYPDITRVAAKTFDNACSGDCDCFCELP